MMQLSTALSVLQLLLETTLNDLRWHTVDGMVGHHLDGVEIEFGLGDAKPFDQQKGFIETTDFTSFQNVAHVRVIHSTRILANGIEVPSNVRLFEFNPMHYDPKVDKDHNILGIPVLGHKGAPFKILTGRH
jgi:hypothetical protein